MPKTMSDSREIARAAIMLAMTATREEESAMKTELAGREIRVMLSELKPDERPRRDIDELRAYPEVKFIN